VRFFGPNLVEFQKCKRCLWYFIDFFEYDGQCFSAAVILCQGQEDVIAFIIIEAQGPVPLLFWSGFCNPQNKRAKQF